MKQCIKVQTSRAIQEELHLVDKAVFTLKDGGDVVHMPAQHVNFAL